MEALVAVGLAGNVVQFAMCVHSLVKEANSIRDTEETENLPAVMMWTRSVTGQAVTLQARMKASRTAFAEEDQVRPNEISRGVWY